MAKRLDILSKDDTREEILYLLEDTFEAVCSMHTDLIEEDFSFDGVLHHLPNFDLTVETIDEEEDGNSDFDSFEEAIEVLNSFHS